MIISPEKRWLFISTRRCATLTFYRQLKKHQWQRIREGGPSPVTHAIPSKRLAETHVTVCRHPYERALSIWRWTNLRSLADRTFNEFLEGWLTCFDTRDYIEGDDPYMYEPCSYWHDRFPHDEVIKFEEMPGSFEALTGVALDWSEKTHTCEHPARDSLNADQRQIIYAWAREDFRRYGYER